MSKNYLAINISNYRRMCICPCSLDKRTKFNLNFELNRVKLIGVLFDSVELLCDLDKDTKIEDSECFIKFEDKTNKNELDTIYFLDNIKYIGNISDGKFNGVGKLYLNDRIYYSGEFKNNLFHGTGMLNSNYCDVYSGDFFEGYANGLGKINWCNGSSYIGMIKENIIDGSGIYRLPNGTTYRGQFKNGYRTGKGEMLSIFRNQYVLEIKSEDWHKDSIGGKGSISCAGKNFYYKGDIKTFMYVRDPHFVWILPHGSGVLTSGCSGNEVYVGQFQFGFKNGNGNEYYLDGSKRYNGNFVDDYFDGKGTLYNRKGEIKYSGNFKMGRRHGEGWSYNNDIVELSNFKNDIKFGKSVYVDSDNVEHVNYYFDKTIVSKKVEGNFSGQCPICQCDYKENDLITDLSECGHVYHSECLFKWLETSNTCPLCRININFNYKNVKKRKINEIDE